MVEGPEPWMTDTPEWTADSGQWTVDKPIGERVMQTKELNHWTTYTPEWTVGQIEMNLNGGNNMVSQLCLRFNH